MALTRERYVSYVNTILNLIAAVHLTYAALYDYLVAYPEGTVPTGLIDMKTCGGKLKYLTFWNEVSFVVLKFFHWLGLGELFYEGTWKYYVSSFILCWEFLQFYV